MDEEEKELRKKKREAKKLRREKKAAKLALFAASNDITETPCVEEVVVSMEVSPEPVSPIEDLTIITKKSLPRKVWGVLTSRWMMLIPAVGLLCLSWWMMQLWGADRDNTILAILSVIPLPVGVYLIYWVWSKRHDDSTIPIVLPGGITEASGGKKKVWPKANSLNIYARKGEVDGVERILPQRIIFEWLPKEELVRLGGQPWQCVNNNQWYFVNIIDMASGLLKPFILPDSQYYDPAEFATVIDMPANKRMFALTGSMFQKVAMSGMLIALVIASIVLIAVQPPPGG